MAVCSGLVWKKLSTIFYVVDMFSSGRAMGPCPEKLLFSKIRSSLVEIMLEVKCFPGSASRNVLQLLRVAHLYPNTALSFTPGHSAKSSSFPMSTFLH